MIIGKIKNQCPKIQGTLFYYLVIESTYFNNCLEDSAMPPASNLKMSNESSHLIKTEVIFPPQLKKKP
jgi:hypothetical protein